MDDQFGRILLDWFASIALVMLGAALTWVNSWLTDIRSRAQARSVAAIAAEARRYELGRASAKELLAAANSAWEELAAIGVGGTVKLESTTAPRTLARLGDQIPNRDIREIANAVAQYLDNPELFETAAEIATFRLPKGPLGPAPVGLKAFLAVESLVNMLNAFLREEDPADFRNPLVDALVTAMQGKRLTAADIYDQY